MSRRAVGDDGVGAELAGVVASLRARRPAIEGAIVERVRSTWKTAHDDDSDYRAGQHETIAAVLDGFLSAIEQGDLAVAPIPPAALALARRAARGGVTLDMIVLRYIAAHRLLGELIADSIDDAEPACRAPLLRRLRALQDSLLERLTAAVTREYRDELTQVQSSTGRRRAELVRKLLAGESPSSAELERLDYELHGWHLGMIASGPNAERTIRELADALHRQPLTVQCGEDLVWGWLGGRRRLAIADVERVLAARETSSSLSVGEPARGLGGWRLTHRAAQAARLVSLWQRESLTCCVDVLLQAALLRDELLAGLLMDAYITPLESMRIGGDTARQTLRAYFTCERQASSAANALGVSRHTVEKRLREIEKCLSRPLHACAAELEVALRLEALGYTGQLQTTPRRDEGHSSGERVRARRSSVRTLAPPDPLYA